MKRRPGARESQAGEQDAHRREREHRRIGAGSEERSGLEQIRGAGEPDEKCGGKEDRDAGRRTHPLCLDRGLESLMAHKIKLGVDASASAGPVGRTAAADTNIAMHSEILTYSRSRGLFAGVSLKGSWFEQNGGDTRTFYGRDIDFRNILSGSVRPPSGSEQFISAVRKDFGEAKAAVQD